MGALLDLAIVALGVVLIVATLIDVVVTVVGVSGGHGLVSGTVSRAVWRGFHAASSDRPRHDLLRLAGPAIFVGITLVWSALVMLGWVLVFWPSQALETLGGDGPTGLWDRFDYATALVFGGSTEASQAGSQPWSFVARIARFSGLGLSSFGLAYALPVVGAVVRLRRTANSINSLGGSDGELATTARLDGEDSVAHLFLISSSRDISDASQLVNAYPILPFFHSKQAATSLPVQVARLVDFLDSEVAVESIPASVREPLSCEIDSLVDVVARHFLPLEREFPDEPAERRTAVIEAWCRYDGWSSSDVRAPAVIPVAT